MSFSIAAPLNSTTGLHLHQLDASNLLDIFDQLNFTDLINVASTHIQFRQLIATRFMIPIYKIHEKTIYLGPKMSFHDNQNEIRIENFNEIVRFLENFGNSIGKLRFNGINLSAFEKNDISSKIAALATKLIEIEIANGGDVLITATKHTLDKVVKVVLQDTGHIDSFQIHRIYPAMKELHIGAATNSIEYIKQTGESLTKLRALYLTGKSSPAYLQIINESLPHLETLGFAYYPRKYYANHMKTNQTVHFHNVHHLQLTIINNDAFSQLNGFPITFKRLTQLEVFATSADDLPIQLMDEHVGLKVLSIPWTSGGDGVVMCLRHTPNLEELQFEWSPDMGANTLQTLTEHGQLRRAIVYVWPFVGDPDRLAAMLPDTWHMTAVLEESTAGNKKHRVTLERKQ